MADMRTYPRGGRVRISARLPEPLLAEIGEIGTVERWSRSATIEALVAEAIDARGMGAERAQGAPSPPPKGHDTGEGGREPLSAPQRVVGVIR